MNRRAFLGVLSFLPFAPKALAKIAESAPTWCVFKPSAVGPSTMTIGGFPLHIDLRCPPGMIYLISDEVFCRDLMDLVKSGRPIKAKGLRVVSPMVRVREQA